MSRVPWSAIGRHEVRLLARGRVAPLILTLLIVTVSYAAFNGTRWVHEQRATIARIEAHDARVYDRIARQLQDLARRGDPHPPLPLAGMAWYLYQPEGADVPAPHLDPRRPEAAASEWVGARHAVLPPAPLAALAVGQSDLHPYYTRVTIRTPPVLVHSDEIENPVNLLSGRFDLAFVLTFCWPVLAMALLYNVISEDRDTGTLALIAAQPVPPRAVLLARIAIRGGVLFLATLVPSLVVLLRQGGLEGARLADLAVWSGVVGATVCFWCGLAALVNTTRWRSTTNAMVLMVLWLTLVVVVPALMGEAVHAAAPVPSRVELINAVRAAGNLTASEIAALVTSYHEDHPDAKPSGLSADATAIRGLAQQDQVDRRIAPILAKYRDEAARQQALANAFRFVSPPLLVHDGVAELAGTTAERYRQFAEQVDAYHREWRRYFYPLVRGRVSLTPEHYDRAPRFAFREAQTPGWTRALWLSAPTAAVGLLMLVVSAIRFRP